MSSHIVGISKDPERRLRLVPLSALITVGRSGLTSRGGCDEKSHHSTEQSRVSDRVSPQPCGCALCVRPHRSAAASRLEIDGCEWKNHSTHFDGVRSARFCSASLFIDETKGSTLAIDSNAYRSACLSLKREYALSAGIKRNDSTTDTRANSGRLAKSDNSSNICRSTA